MAEKNRLRQIRNRWLDIEQSYNVPLLYKDTEGVFGRAPTLPKTAPALALQMERLFLPV